MQITTLLDMKRQTVHKRALYQAPFMVAAFVPRVGKEDMHAIQTVFAQHAVHHFDGVVLHDADIANVFFTAAFEQGAYTGCVHFTAQKIIASTRLGNLGGCVAHAKTDFQNERRLATKGRYKVKLFVFERQQKLRSKLLKRPCLTWSHAPCAQHVGFDDAHERGVDFGWWRSSGGVGSGHG